MIVLRSRSTTRVFRISIVSGAVVMFGITVGAAIRMATSAGDGVGVALIGFVVWGLAARALWKSIQHSIEGLSSNELKIANGSTVPASMVRCIEVDRQGHAFVVLENERRYSLPQDAPEALSAAWNVIALWRVPVVDRQT